MNLNIPGVNNILTRLIKTIKKRLSQARQPWLKLKNWALMQISLLRDSSEETKVSFTSPDE